MYTCTFSILAIMNMSACRYIHSTMGILVLLTRTEDPSILRGSTVVNPRLLSPTVQQSALVSHTSYIIKNDPTISLTKMSPSHCCSIAWMQDNSKKKKEVYSAIRKKGPLLNLQAGIFVTVFIVAKLVAHYCGILTVPAVIADSAPVSMKTHLHSSLVDIAASSQTDVSCGTVARCTY